MVFDVTAAPYMIVTNRGIPPEVKQNLIFNGSNEGSSYPRKCCKDGVDYPGLCAL